jgi:hypothetical protein
MFKGNAGSGRSRTDALGALSVLEMKVEGAIKSASFRRRPGATVLKNSSLEGRRNFLRVLALK